MLCTNTRLDKLDNFDLTNGGVIILHLKNVMLLPGVYTVDFAIEAEIAIPVDYYREAATIEIYSVNDDVGIVRIEHDWRIS